MSKPSKEDSYDAYTLALIIAIVTTLTISYTLHRHKCVPPDYFPQSDLGLSAILLVGLALLVSSLARGISVRVQGDRDNIRTGRFSLQSMPQWLVEILILIPSIVSLHLLLYTSGGVFGPFNAYLGTFPIVISFVSNSRLFVWLTVILTLLVYVWNLFYAPQVIPAHDFHYRQASLVAYVVALGYTAVQVVSGLRKEEMRSFPEDEGELGTKAAGRGA